MLRPYLKIWNWELIFGRAVKAISSPGVRSPWAKSSNFIIIENQILKGHIWGEEDVRVLRERPLMMSDFRGDGGSEMTQKNRTLEGKNRMLGEMGIKNRRTSFMDDH